MLDSSIGALQDRFLHEHFLLVQHTEVHQVFRDRDWNATVHLSTNPHRICQFLEHEPGRIEVDASIGDADTVLEMRRALGRDLLIAVIDVGFDHDTLDRILALA